MAGIGTVVDHSVFLAGVYRSVQFLGRVVELERPNSRYDDKCAENRLKNEESLAGGGTGGLNGA